MASIDTYTLRRLLEGPTQQVESQCVESFDYDMPSETLTITFPGSSFGAHGGQGVYRYSGFPLDEFVLFSGSSSKGTYFNLYIKNRYPTDRIA